MSVNGSRQETRLGWYIAYSVLTLFTGSTLIRESIGTARTVVVDHSSDPLDAFAAVGAWVLVGLLFAFCLSRVMRIQKARKQAKDDVKAKKGGSV